jgi:hypothetical protein
VGTVHRPENMPENGVRPGSGRKTLIAILTTLLTRFGALAFHGLTPWETRSAGKARDSRRAADVWNDVQTFATRASSCGSTL